MRRGIGRAALVMLVAGVVAVGLFAGTASTARADYGPGTQHQVEISANNVQGGNFWFWAALGPGQESDYQNTDCIHLVAGGNPGAPVGAAHSSGELDGWSDTGGVIEMDGVSIVGGAAKANFYISDAQHSNQFTIVVTWEAAPFFPLNVPLTWSGRGVQVQVAPEPTNELGGSRHRAGPPLAATRRAQGSFRNTGPGKS
jgi:hypothetical protein